MIYSNENSDGDDEHESFINSESFVVETFKLFREMLGNTTPLKNMSDKIFGAKFNLMEALENENYIETIGKILRASINSFLILDKFTKYRETKYLNQSAHLHNLKKMDFDKRQFSGKSQYKSPTLINLDSGSVRRDRQKYKKPGKFKTYNKSKYVMETKEPSGKIEEEGVIGASDNPRSYKNLMLSPYKPFSPA